VSSSCEDGNEPAGSIYGDEFAEQLGDYQLLRHTAPWS
jgi:hypothetical protein